MEKTTPITPSTDNTTGLNLHNLLMHFTIMKEKDCIISLAYIRNTLKLKTPIIPLTVDVTTVDVAKCKAVGMNDYIAKPSE